MQVTAESPIIDVKQNAAVATINTEVIERHSERPRLHRPDSRPRPARSQERKSGIQIDGAGGSEHRYVIDGMDTTGIRTGVSGQELPTDFVQEVQVKSSGYNAEFRATTGGVISAITKTRQQQLARQRRLSTSATTASRATQRPTLRLNPADQTKAEYVHDAGRRILAHRADVRSRRADPAAIAPGSMSATAPDIDRTRAAR